MSARSVNRLVTENSPAPSSELPRRILAIDYGTLRLGLAISDELQSTARPLAVLKRANRRELFRNLRKICRDHGVARILVGHPLYLSGDSSPMAQEASKFAARLHKESGLDVELADERLTTWEARRTVREPGLSSRRKSAPVDDVAAAILLREYLNRLHNSNSAPTPGGRNRR
jgi:putative holliday junction resolvase